MITNFEFPYHRPLSFLTNGLMVKLSDITQSGQLTNGKYCREVEDRVKQMYGVRYAITTSNCTSGLSLCYQYFKGLDNRMWIPNFQWISVYLTARELGYELEFVDIDKETWLMEPANAPRHKVKSPVHTFGNITTVEDDYRVVFDGAHAFGCKLKNIGDATVFSFAATKIITACEGGCIITDSPELYDFVNYRRDKMARMSELHAAYLLETLPYLDKTIAFKKVCYEYYKLHIPGTFQKIPLESNYNVIGFLNTNNLIIPKEIETRQYYQPVYQEDLLPNSYEVYRNIICLPSYFGVDYKEITKRILEANQ